MTYNIVFAENIYLKPFAAQKYQYLPDSTKAFCKVQPVQADRIRCIIIYPKKCDPKTMKN